MIKAVLLDLDDTLLHVDTNAFSVRYSTDFLKLLYQRHPDLARFDPPVHKLWQQAIVETVTNTDPTLTNSDVFSNALARYKMLPPEVMAAVFEEFHAVGYLHMQEMTKPVPGTRQLIERLAGMGITIAIATNPLFALDAVKQRIKWAGLDDLSHHFAIVGNIEEFHFAKPNPHFYEEVLARIGVEADEAIMVGDSLDQDMIPAAQAGLNTYWLHLDRKLPADLPESQRPNAIGTIAAFDQLVADGWLATLKTRARTFAQLKPRMLGDMGALFGLASTIKPEYWNMQSVPDQWSPLEIVCHLRESERNVQRPRLQRIAREDNPFISQTPPPPGPKEQDLTSENGPAVLRELWEERCQTIQFLDDLSEEDWKRPARHSIFGPTTLLEMAHFTTRHDHLHINQLCETVGRCKQQV